MAQYLLEASTNKATKILLSQPRRVGAVSVARHIAKQKGVRLGSDVGFQIGGRKACWDQTSILVVTLGMIPYL